MDWELVWDSFPLIWKGAKATITLTAWALLFGTAGALALALMRLSSVKPLRWFAAGFGWRRVCHYLQRLVRVQRLLCPFVTMNNS